MKRMIAMLLAVSLLLSLCACGRKEAAGRDATYDALIEYTEAGDAEQAMQEVLRLTGGEGAMMAEEAEPAAEAPEAPVVPARPFHVVEITMDNWEEYFELASDACWEINGFGEAEHMWYDLMLCLREPYRDKVVLSPTEGELAGGAWLSMEEALAAMYDCKIDIELHYTSIWRKVTVDLDARTYVFGEPDRGWAVETKTQTSTIYQSGFSSQRDTEREIWPAYSVRLWLLGGHSD